MKLIDQHGNPFDSGVLREPQTARIAALQHELVESQLDGLTPARAARILRDADQGDLVAQHQLFDDMLDRDAHLSCEYGKRAGAPLTLDWSIEPPSNATEAEKKAAAMVEAMLRDAVDDLEDVILAMMEGPGHGFAAIELEWQRWGREWIPAFHPRPQTWFRTDTSRRVLRLNDGTGDGVEPIPMGWILHMHRKVKTGYLGRAGLFRACLWPFLYKAYGIGDFAEFLETYGLPIILGKYMPGATPEEKSSLMRAVAALGHDARAIMPDGMAIEIQKITGGGEGSHHLNMVGWADGAQSKAILGQVLSSEAKATGMGSGVADLHREVRRDILEADARQLAGTLTRDLVYPLLVLNGGGIESYRRCPRWVFDLGEAADITAYAEALPKLVGVGFKVPRKWGHEKLRIPEPDGTEDVLEIPRPEMVASPAFRDDASGAKGGPARAVKDSLTTDAPEAATRARWRRTALAALRATGPAAADGADPADQIAPRLAVEAQAQIEGWLATIEAAIAAMPEATPAQVQARLLELFGDLPTDELVEVMTQGFVLAELVGRDDVSNGD
ncbi:MAG TPA: DUF935 domain-containing protein [Azoarcus taiwanensis]|nr:DUF935 domain-containing protein [Azoarcus taiwanensis]